MQGLQGAALAGFFALGFAPALAQSPQEIIVPPGAETASFVGGDYDPRTDPGPVLEVAKAIAKASNRRVLLEVGGDWCSWCHVLDDFVAKDVAVQQALAGSFVVMKVYWGFDNRNRQLLDRFPKASGYPHFYVLESDGSFLASQGTAELEQEETYDRQRMLAFAARWRKPGRLDDGDCGLPAVGESAAAPEC